MNVFRWIIGGLALLLGLGSLLSFALFIAFDIEVWRGRARTLWRGVTMALLLWFNVEIWGPVLWTLTHW
ncbi:MAG TPA: hypothetical protein VNU71_21760 [Burkholderiaceae bacterium]|nr:hypothetical protein [Burkholderiaceae bacterium]